MWNLLHFKIFTVLTLHFTCVGANDTPSNCVERVYEPLSRRVTRGVTPWSPLVSPGRPLRHHVRKSGVLDRSIRVDLSLLRALTTGGFPDLVRWRDTSLTSARPPPFIHSFCRGPFRLTPSVSLSFGALVTGQPFCGN